ncbi:mucin-19-like isoform X5 [Protopterus annectens]|uniref:mucin-19-like isoform X5 n=1 Tax=Protopterus annectens TaxID=7888 RepID=UPI001CFAAE9E|nr:mucin-19-like isoform X5 [Protopterus annectens]
MNLNILILLWAFCLSKGLVANAQSQNSVICCAFGKGGYLTTKNIAINLKSTCVYNFVQQKSDSLPAFAATLSRDTDGNLENIKISIGQATIDLKQDSVTIDGNIQSLPVDSGTLHAQKTEVSITVTDRSSSTEFVYNYYENMICVTYDANVNITGLCEGVEPVTDDNLLDLERRSVVPNPDKPCSPEFPTSNNESVCENGTQTCSAIKKYLGPCPDTIQNEILKVCSIDVCTSGGRKESACSSLSLLVQMCFPYASYSELKLWRSDPDIACAPPVCEGDLEYNECSTRPQEICSSAELSLSSSTFPNNICVRSCNCPSDLVLNDLGANDTCIPRTECPCKYDKQVYQPGFNLTTPYSSCVCASGTWNCKNQESPAMCKLEVGGYIQTFDGTAYAISGNCEYRLVQTQNISIIISIQQSQPSEPQPAVEYVTIIKTETATHCTLWNDGTVSVDGKEISESYKGKDFEVIKESSMYTTILFSSNLQMQAQTYPLLQLYITALPDAHGKTTGLCGIFNDKGSDDLTSPDNIIESDPTIFADKWKTKSCTDPDRAACVNMQNEKYAESSCSVLKDSSGVFGPCHSAEDFKPYYEKCKSTTCISNQPTTTMCESLGNYAKACALKNRPVGDWRNGTCEVQCENGMVFRYDMTACNQTCQSQSVPDFTCNVNLPPVEGCGCPDGKFIDMSGNCVEKDRCECYIKNTVVLPDHPYTDGSTKCYCYDGKLHCVNPLPQTEECFNGSYYVDCSDVNIISERTCSDGEMPTYKTCTPGCYCPEPLVKYNDTCIDVEDCPCSFGGILYSTGTTVQSKCQNCTCFKGTWECTEDRCTSKCYVSGDGSYVTLDEKWYKFDGTCEYILVTDACGKDNGSLVITTKSVPCCQNGVVCSRITKVQYMNKMFTIEDGTITVDFSSKTCEDAYPDYKIHSNGVFVTLELENGVTVSSDKHTYVSIAMDERWTGNTCGLCGNNNDNVKDDFITRDKMQVGDSVTFANTWKTEGAQCPDVVEQKFPCELNQYCYPKALQKCSIIKGDIFKACHAKVNPEGAYYRCIQEACSCNMEATFSGFCTAVALYAKECNNLGVCISWRNTDLCPVSCDYYNQKGDCSWHYNACGPSEGLTCSGEAVKDFASGLEGCYAKCPNHAPYLDENYNRCVSLSECSCRSTNQIVPANGIVQFKADNCCLTCVCANGKMICEEGCNATTTTTTTAATISMTTSLHPLYTTTAAAPTPSTSASVAPPSSTAPSASTTKYTGSPTATPAPTTAVTPASSPTASVAPPASTAPSASTIKYTGSPTTTAASATAVTPASSPTASVAPPSSAAVTPASSPTASVAPTSSAASTSATIAETTTTAPLTTTALRLTTVHPTTTTIKQVTEKQVSGTTGTTSTEITTPPQCLCKTNPPRKPFESWQQDCGDAFCTENCTIITTPRECPIDKPCNYSVTINDDDCCPRQECYCKCAVWGEPHYLSFGGVKYDFPGNCSYVLVQEKSAESDFKVIVDNIGSDTYGSSVKGLVVEYKTEVLTLSTHQNAIYLNNGLISAPYAGNSFRIRSTCLETIVVLSNGARIKMGQSGDFVIELPEEKFSGNTEGQCGVCGGKSCIRSSGKVEPDTCCQATANDWLIPDQNKPQCTTISKPCTVPPIQPPPTEKPVPCSDLCCILEKFENCVPPDEFSFLKDSCAYDYEQKRNRTMLCAGLSYAAKQCSSCIDWRSEALDACNPDCPSGLQYYTCKNTTEQYCDGTEPKPYEDFDSKQEGCYCPEGMIRESKHSDKCVTQCSPCCGPQGEPKYIGDQWTSNCYDCICSGITEQVECTPRACPPVPKCQSNEVLKTYNDSDSCCPIQICEPVTCMYKETQYKANDKWSDSCLDCECDAVSNSVTCQCHGCPPYPVCSKTEKLVITPNPLDPCCNSSYCEPLTCNFNQIKYNPGDKWTTFCQECICDKTTASVICIPKTCPQDPVCRADQQLIKTFSNGSCCPVSQCVPKTCVYQGNTYTVGQSFVDSKDKCLKLNCTASGLDSSYEKCLYQNYCPVNNRIYSPTSCCYSCQYKCLPVPKTVRLVNNTCQADVVMAECRGDCTAFNLTARNDALVNTCACCDVTATTTKVVNLVCPNGSTKKHYYQDITSCDCLKCSK